MEPKNQALEAAKQAARCISFDLSLSSDRVPTVALVLGTGWGNTLHLNNERSMFFDKIDGFTDLIHLDGHERVVACGDLNGRRVIVLRGRIHMNEHPTDENIPDMVRLQIQMLCELGVKSFILTNAVGGLEDNLKYGSVVVANGLIMLFAGAMPLYAGEFVSPAKLLSPDLQDLAISCAPKGLEVRFGVYSMIRGPAFESRQDKNLLILAGAKTVGMSLLPELHVLALYPDTEAVCLSLVTDELDETADHTTNQKRAGDSAALLGEYLECIVACLDA